MRWKDAPAAYGPHKTLYNRFRRWAEKGVFQRIFAELAGMYAHDGTVILDSTQAYRTAASLLQKKGGCRCLARTRGELNSKLHVICDDRDKQLILLIILLTEGQKSDMKGAEHMLEHLPRNTVLIADRAYDSKAFRDALAERGITVCIPSSRTRKIPIPHE